MTDQEALQTFATDKSEEAFRQLVERYSQMIYSVAFRTLNNSADAQDVTQIVFTRLAQKAHRLSKEVILSGWLYRAALMEAQNYRRKSQRRFQREEEIQQMMHEPKTVDQDSPWETVRIHLDQAIGKLPVRLQNAVVLHFLEGKTQRETAQLLGCDEDAVRKRLSRSLEKLRTIFSRRNVTISTIALTSYLSTHRVEATPSTLNEIVLKTVMKASSKGLLTVGFMGAIVNILTSISPKVAMTVVAFLVGFGAIELAKYEAKTTSSKTIQSQTDPLTSNPNSKIISKVQPASSPKRSQTLEQRFNQLLAKIKSEGWTKKNTELLVQLAEDIAVEDPDLAFTFYKKLPSSKKTEKYGPHNFINSFFSKLAKTNINKATQLAEGIPQGEIRSSVLLRIGWIWAESDPKKGAKWLETLPIDNALGFAYWGFARSWSKKDPNSAVLWASQLTDKYLQSEAWDSILKEVRLIDGKTAIEWIQKQNPPKDTISSFIMAWAKTEPEKALDYLFQQPKSSERDFNICDIFASWVKIGDGQAAILKMSQLPQGELRNSVAVEMAYKLSEERTDHSNYQSLAMSLISQLQQNNPNLYHYEQQKIGKILARNIIGTMDYDQSILWANQLQLPAEQKAGALEEIMHDVINHNHLPLILNTLGTMPENEIKTIDLSYVFSDMGNDAKGFETTISAIQQFSISNEEKARLLADTFSWWVFSDPVIATDAALKIADPKLQELIWPKLVEGNTKRWSQTNFDWISKLPAGNAKDKTLQSAINTFANSDNNPRGFIAADLTPWITSIQNENIRVETITNVASSLKEQQGLPAVVKWINQQNIPQSEKGRFIQKIKTNPGQAQK